ncbi:hypothetical protein FISHEDRAFT_52860 [Fistulina hepatica ATCC 64428]|nr:hypothetical protein FISHEDRAFT_52860 [Fistulina hepatica ATCC 64428]
MAARTAQTVLTGLRPGLRYTRHCVRAHQQQQRTLFNWWRRRKEAANSSSSASKEPVPILTQDNLFHSFSKSPFPQIRARGEAIQSLAHCPVCLLHNISKHVHFECPDCGWPTHCSEAHWKDDSEHAKYCKRLRDANEDDHDLRSGRRLFEFEMPGPQGYEEAISFANWDSFWYTRQFFSMDTERSRRHSSKLLSFPITVGSVLHQYSNLTLSNQRLTPEGSRSMAAIRSTLHVPTGAPETTEATVGKPQVRIFMLGARAESSLPVHVWEQLCLLFPAAELHLFFIGPQVSLPRDPTTETAQGSTTAPNEAAGRAVEPSMKEEEKAKYYPNVWEPPTPAPIERQKFTRSAIGRYNVPSYTTPYTRQLTVTGLCANYIDVHHYFENTLDPYKDVFFFFSPGFGFPSPTSVGEDGKPLLQISSPTEWGPVLPALLASKCPIFVTGFSPVDVERDVKSLATAKGVAGEFDWIITPGPNTFASEKWEVADFDPRVMIRVNWGIWGIRGKMREVTEQGFFSTIFSRS